MTEEEKSRIEVMKSNQEENDKIMQDNGEIFRNKFLTWLETERNCFIKQIEEDHNFCISRSENEVDKWFANDVTTSKLDNFNAIYNAIVELAKTPKVLFGNEYCNCDLITNKILKKHPLTPLTGNDDEWEIIGDNNYHFDCVQMINKRYPLLHKFVFNDNVYFDNKIVYVDFGSVEVLNKYGEDAYSAQSIIFYLYWRGFFTVEFPYTVPDKPNKKVYTDLEGICGQMKLKDYIEVNKLEEFIEYMGKKTWDVHLIFIKAKDTKDIDEFEIVNSIQKQMYSHMTQNESWEAFKSKSNKE